MKPLLPKQLEGELLEMEQELRVKSEWERKKISPVTRFTPELKEARTTDTTKIIEQLVHEREIICELFCWKSIDIALRIRDKIGERGVLHLIDADEKSLIEMWQNLQKSKEDYHESFFRNPVFKDEFQHRLNRYQKTFSPNQNPEFIIKVIKQFLSGLGIIFHGGKFIPPLPKELENGSLNLILERNGFAFAPEDCKEGVLEECDRLLRRDGIFCFKDSPRELIVLKNYYGADILKDYTEIKIPNLVLPSEWMILQKF